jgi:hypothetical protein
MALHSVASVRTVCTVLYISVALKCVDDVLSENAICFIHWHT